VLSRAVMPVLMTTLPNARSSGLSQSVGQPRAASVCLGVFLALMIATSIIGLESIAVAAAMGVTTLAVALIARKKIGGQTGDVLGTGQSIAELTGLLILLVT